MYKFVAIDIDGTLLNSAGELSLRNREAVKKTSENDVKVVLTSGRVTESVRKIAAQMPIYRYMICDNGATIYDTENEKFIYTNSIDKDTVLEIVDMCIENNIYYMVFTTDEIIVKDLRHMALAFYKKRHNCNDENSGVSQIKYATRNYIENVNVPFTRIVICDQDRSIYNSIINKLKNYTSVELMAPPHISNKIIKDGEREYVISYSYAELLPKNSNKWNAIKYLADKLNIKDEEIIAIGDNFNDISMIQNAGLGIAMNNGSPTAKEVARIIAPSNDKDGVAVVLEEYILKKNGEL